MCGRTSSSRASISKSSLDVIHNGRDGIGPEHNDSDNGEIPTRVRTSASVHLLSPNMYIVWLEGRNGRSSHHGNTTSILNVRSPSRLAVRGSRNTSCCVGSELLDACALELRSREAGEDGASCDGRHGGGRKSGDLFGLNLKER